MGIFDSVKAMAEEYAGGGGDHAQVAGGLIQELTSGSGGVSGLIQSLQQNGAGGLLQQWAGGQTAPASPDSVEQGLSGTGLIENIAQRANLSPDTVKAGLATILPIVVQHLSANGHVTADGQPTENAEPDSGSLLQSVLGKLV